MGRPGWIFRSCLSPASFMEITNSSLQIISSCCWFIRWKVKYVAEAKLSVSGLIPGVSLSDFSLWHGPSVNTKYPQCLAEGEESGHSSGWLTYRERSETEHRVMSDRSSLNKPLQWSRKGYKGKLKSNTIECWVLMLSDHPSMPGHHSQPLLIYSRGLGFVTAWWMLHTLDRNREISFA